MEISLKNVLLAMANGHIMGKSIAIFLRQDMNINAVDDIMKIVIENRLMDNFARKDDFGKLYLDYVEHEKEMIKEAANEDAVQRAHENKELPKAPDVIYL